MTQFVDLIPPPARGRRSGPRGSVFVWANIVVLGWLALAVALLAVHDVLGLPVWVALHALLLGAVTNAIVIWSEHFVVTLCRVPGPPPRRLALGLTVLNLFITAALIGVAADATVVAGAGGAGVAVIATVHTIALFRMTRTALPGRFGYLVGYYTAASAALVLGALSGAALAIGAAQWYVRLWTAHVHLTLLGWVGLSVLGTLFTLWPTTTGTRITDSTLTAARRALPTLAAGLLAAVAGMLTATVWVTVAGLLCYTAGIVLTIIPLRPATTPHGPAAWMLAAATAWLGISVLLDAVRLLVAGSVEDLPGVVTTVMPVLAVGFAAQVLVGALTKLLPVVLGRGPAEHRAIADILARGWQLRLIAANLAVPLVAVGLPSPLPQLGWALAALSVATFLVLALRVAIPVARRGAFPLEPAQKQAHGTTSGVLAGLIAVALAVAVAGSGQDTTATAPVSAPTHTVEVTLTGMRVHPDTVDVPAGTRLVLRVTNQEAMPHDLRLDTGQHTPRLHHGETALLDVGPVGETRHAWCTVAGHRAAGMTMTIRTPSDHQHTTPDSHSDDNGNNSDTAPTAGLDLAADPTPGWVPRDATLAPTTATLHRIELRATEQDLEVAPGRRERRWTFADTSPGTVPGPTLHGRVGDQFEITLINDTTIGHGMDFHASALAPDGPMRTIGPGERLVYRFTATRAGAWLYHCSTMPMSQHIANGMYGAVIIDPPDLPAVDHEYLMVSSQLYLGAPGSDNQVRKIQAGQPDGWMFNGMAAQYDHAPLTAHPGQRIRIWLVNAGPGDSTAFHVVGAQFDTVYKEGARLLRPSETAGGAQVLDLAPAQGGFVELTFPEPGHYPFVDHDMRHAENGAHGLFTVTEQHR
ncbi:multicopper oxidase domain-containing protein [Saccharothrix violaceirubra]|uniref:Copper-containing nitrite reductase n=1 Tax=Saccharothrix violaceirubra TaxID=413306 RepID=A0A7W7WXN3_9PSEU|nr:multicopper oxidase domain-containing protein [Saccharothrix violaceirubra]MBB4966813.1 nitrite reductase (NO-forming) [Saccharothrix violaceirubra]